MDKSKNLLAEAESGWDFTPRFNGRALDYAPVDLNSVMYKNERILSEFAVLCGKNDEAMEFSEKADFRRDIMLRLMKNKDNIFVDYNFTDRTLSEIISAASFLPYWAGISDDRETCEKLAKSLEYEYGLSACEKTDRKIYQWDYPNMWPPLVSFAVSALRAVGAKKQALQIAKKYLSTVSNNFEKDGCLYEKYSAVNGCYSESEYKSPKMLGWTAGVFRYLYEFCKKEDGVKSE